jgi:multiple sugar transport system ATP-binding protein
VATVTFEHVSKSYESKEGEVRAVDDLCLEVVDREFLVLVGPSGCGKTTTLRLLAGLESIDRGNVRIGGRVVNDVAPKDRNIAMVFQNYALYPHMTVFRNMAFGLRMRRVPKTEQARRVHEVAGMLGIEDLLDRKPGALSGGERQRVAVGRAIVRTPEVFLFDEPLSNLDARLRVHTRTEIKSLHRKLQTTILYVTHDQEEAMTLGDRLAIMNNGVIQQCGAPLDIYNEPVNRFVAGFVGTPSMNFLNGRIEVVDSSVFFAGKAGRLRIPDGRAGPLQAHDGRPVTLGVRPEHLSFQGIAPRFAGAAPSGDAGDSHVSSIKASVALVEPLGDSINVHLAGGHGEPIVARMSPTTSLSAGQEVNLVLDMTRAYIFGADERGERLA